MKVRFKIYLIIQQLVCSQKSFPACSLCARKNNAVIWYHFFLDIPTQRPQPNLHFTNVRSHYSFQLPVKNVKDAVHKSYQSQTILLKRVNKLLSFNWKVHVQRCLPFIKGMGGIRYIIYCNLFSKNQYTHMLCILRGM